jgi:branched-subunit amino acid ABC-type transport system permease component
MREKLKVTVAVLAFVAAYIGVAIYAGGIEGSFTVTFLLNGLQAAALFTLLALGLSLIFGMAGIINFAHGAIFLLGAYVTWYVSTLGFGYILSVVAAVVATGVFGLLIEVIGLRRLYEKDELLQILYTFGIGLGFQGLVTFVVGPSSRSINPPGWGTGSVTILGAQYPLFRLLIIVFTIVLIGIVWFMLQRTNIGLIIRAGTRDAEMTRILGHNVERMFTLVFVLGSMLAGIAGALAIPIRPVSPVTGNEIIIETFVVVVVGGLGSFLGTILGGISIAQILTFGSYIPVIEQYSSTAIFVFMALVLLIRPRGFLGSVGFMED